MCLIPECPVQGLIQKAGPCFSLLLPETLMDPRFWAGGLHRRPCLSQRPESLAQCPGLWQDGGGEQVAFPQQSGSLNLLQLCQSLSLRGCLSLIELLVTQGLLEPSIEVCVPA